MRRLPGLRGSRATTWLASGKLGRKMTLSSVRLASGVKRFSRQLFMDSPFWIGRPRLTLLRCLCLELVPERPLELFEFGPNDRHAIGLPGIVRVIVLAVRFGGIKRRERHNLGDDRRIEHPCCVEPPLVLLGKLLLLWGVTADDRTVRRSDGSALGISSR